MSETREGPTSLSLLVLCECRQAIDHTHLPPEVSPGIEERAMGHHSSPTKEICN